MKDGCGGGGGDDRSGISVGSDLLDRQSRRLDNVPVFSTDVTRCVLQGGSERDEL